VFSVLPADLVPAAEVDPAAMEQVVALGGNVDQQFFAYDMDDLYSVSKIEEYADVTGKPTDYLFFMTPDTGAGCAIAVDAAARQLVELIDGERTLAQIQAQMTITPELAPRIHATLAAAGLLDRPRFLSEFEAGTVSWQSCFPEVYRAYH
jgi:hypothetical protein